MVECGKKTFWPRHTSSWSDTSTRSTRCALSFTVEIWLKFYMTDSDSLWVDRRLCDQVFMVSSRVQLNRSAPFVYTHMEKYRNQAGGDDMGVIERPNDAVADHTESKCYFFLDCPFLIASTAYISNRQLVLSLADASCHLMYAYKDMLELAGLTTQLYTLISTLHSKVKSLPTMRLFSTMSTSVCLLSHRMALKTMDFWAQCSTVHMCIHHWWRTSRLCWNKVNIWWSLAPTG